MQGITHLAIAAAAGAAAAPPCATLPERLIYAGIAGVAGLIPDWLQVNIPGAKQIKGAFGHRGFSHWIWTAAAVAYLVGKAYPTAVVPTLVGWVSHIILDMLSNGAPAIWPLGRITLARIKTGGKMDMLFGATGLIAVILIIVGEIWKR